MNTVRKAISNQPQGTRKMLNLAGGTEYIGARPQRAAGAPPRSQPVNAAKPEENPLSRYEKFCTEWFMPREEANQVADRSGAT